MRDIVLLLAKDQQMKEAFLQPHLGAFFAPQKTGLCGGSVSCRDRGATCGGSAPLQSLAHFDAGVLPQAKLHTGYKPCSKRGVCVANSRSKTAMRFYDPLQSLAHEPVVNPQDLRPNIHTVRRAAYCVSTKERRQKVHSHEKPPVHCNTSKQSNRAVFPEGHEPHKPKFQKL
jgi:hypothetical protein